MKILHFIILVISICIITSKVNTLFNKLPQVTNRPTNWGNQGSQESGVTSVIPPNSGSAAITNNYQKQYNCLKETKNYDFNPLLKEYESNCRWNNNNCSTFISTLYQMKNSCVQLRSKCNCEKNKKLYQAMGCAGPNQQVHCIHPTI